MWKIGITGVALLLCVAADTSGTQAAGRGGGGGGGGFHGGGGGGAAVHVGGGGGGGAMHFGGGGGGAMHFGGGGGAPHVNFARPGGGAVPHISMAPHVTASPHVSAMRPSGGFARFGGVGHSHSFSSRAGGGTHFSGTHFNGSRFSSGRSATRSAHAAHVSGSRLTGTTSHTTGRGALAAQRGTVTGATHGIGTTGSGGTVGRTTGRNGAAIRAAGTAAAAGAAGRTSGIHGAADPRAFAGRRNFANNPVFNRFAGGFWHHHHHFHIGWIGPLFWPYAYGDLFYYSLWPYEYADVDPFWDYGYDDIYQTVFWPYSDEEYVQGRSSRARRATITHAVAQTCTDETGEVTGWPIDQIQDVVQPNAEQRALLDDLGNAVVKASQVIREACPKSIPFTPLGRLDQMQQRIEALVRAAEIVQPALAKFYDSLSDDQKARFNNMGAPAKETVGAGGASQADQSPQATCQANITPWPTDRVAGAVHPNAEQRVKLDALADAAAKAGDVVKASCPTELPATPPGRLDAAIKRLDAMLKGIAIVRPALADFYNSLDDEQKARFNRLGREMASKG